ncbi:hypothetical protein [Streptomyces sp. YIM S03343]
MATALVALAAGALTWFTGASSAPAAGHTASGAATSVVDEAPGYAVENFNYPNADKILAEKNIVLKRGDGHIMLADCSSGTGLLQIMAREKSDPICFQVVGNSGWLTLEIPSVVGVRGNSYDTQVDMTVGTEEKSFDVTKNAWTPVGEVTDPDGRDYVLVEIRSTK